MHTVTTCMENRAERRPVRIWSASMRTCSGELEASLPQMYLMPNASGPASVPLRLFSPGPAGRLRSCGQVSSDSLRNLPERVDLTAIVRGHGGGTRVATTTQPAPVTESGHRDARAKRRVRAAAPGSDAVTDSLNEDSPLAGWRSTWHALGRPGLRSARQAGGADPLRRRARPWPDRGSARVSAPRPWSGR